MSAAIDSSAVPAPRHPLVELLSRYAAVFKASWAHRHELAGPERMLHEAAFLPAALALQETPPHPAPRRLVVAICALFAIALLWACLGQVDIVAVAQGRIVVSQRSKTIQPLEAGVIHAIHVKDGDHVRAGAPLIDLDGTLTAADAARVTDERSAAQSEAARAKALLLALDGSAPPRLPAMAAALTERDQAALPGLLQHEWAELAAKLQRYQAEAAHKQAEIATAEQAVGKLETTLPLARQREQDFKTLSDQGFVAGHAGQDRTRERIEQERDLATAHARLAEARAALTESQQGLTAWRAEARRTLQDRQTQAELKSRQLAEEATKAHRRDALTRLTAPVDGTVQQLAVHTTGGVVTPAQVLLVLVPDDEQVTAEVVLDNKDVGFVRQGQAATIKLETFQYTRYGTVPAQVIHVAADAVQDEKRGAIFPVSLRLQQASLEVDGRRIQLSPGMNLSAEIKTGRRRVIDFLLSPVQQHLGESMGER